LLIFFFVSKQYNIPWFPHVAAAFPCRFSAILVQRLRFLFFKGFFFSCRFHNARLSIFFLPFLFFGAVRNCWLAFVYLWLGPQPFFLQNRGSKSLPVSCPTDQKPSSLPPPFPTNFPQLISIDLFNAPAVLLLFGTPDPFLSIARRDRFAAPFFLITFGISLSF